MDDYVIAQQRGMQKPAEATLIACSRLVLLHLQALLITEGILGWDKRRQFVKSRLATEVVLMQVIGRGRREGQEGSLSQACGALA